MGFQLTRSRRPSLLLGIHLHRSGKPRLLRPSCSSSRAYSAVSAALSAHLRSALAAICTAHAARLSTWRVPTATFFPPVMSLSGHNPSQEANADALRNRDRSGPTSASSVWAVRMLTPGTSLGHGTAPGFAGPAVFDGTRGRPRVERRNGTQAVLRELLDNAWSRSVDQAPVTRVSRSVGLTEGTCRTQLDRGRFRRNSAIAQPHHSALGVVELYLVVGHVSR